MSIQAHVAALRQHLEQLFPGKLISGKERLRTLLTGLPEIDRALGYGLQRQRIVEWVGPASSGKTTLLRAAIANWCVAGCRVAYVDTADKLLPSDWIFVEQGICGALPANMVINITGKSSGEFWVVHLTEKECSLRSGDELAENRTGAMLTSGRGEGRSRWDIEEEVARQGLRRAAGRRAMLTSGRGEGRSRWSDYIWIVDQLMRSSVFDVVVLDLGGFDKERTSLSSRMYARLQRSLDCSKAAFIVVRDGNDSGAGWGCHARLEFGWGESAQYEAGVAGLAMILPVVQCCVSKNGVSKTMEVMLNSHVSNRLFAHPSVPDRRTSQA